MVNDNKFIILVKKAIETDNWSLQSIDLDRVGSYLTDLFLFLRGNILYLKRNNKPISEEQYLRYARIHTAYKSEILLYYEVIYEILSRIAPDNLPLYNHMFYSLSENIHDDIGTEIEYSDLSKRINPISYNYVYHRRVTPHSIRDIRTKEPIIYHEIERKIRLDDEYPYTIRIDYPTNNSSNGYLSFCYRDLNRDIYPLAGVIGHFNEWVDKINDIKKYIKANNDLLTQIKNLEKAIMFNKTGKRKSYYITQDDGTVESQSYKDESEFKENEDRKNTYKTLVIDGYLHEKLSEGRSKYHKDVNLELFNKYTTKIEELDASSQNEKIKELNTQLNICHASFPKIEEVLKRY